MDLKGHGKRSLEKPLYLQTQKKKKIKKKKQSRQSRTSVNSQLISFVSFCRKKHKTLFNGGIIFRKKMDSSTGSPPYTSMEFSTLYGVNPHEADEAEIANKVTSVTPVSSEKEIPERLAWLMKLAENVQQLPLVSQGKESSEQVEQIAPVSNQNLEKAELLLHAHAHLNALSDLTSRRESHRESQEQTETEGSPEGTNEDAAKDNSDERKDPKKTFNQ